MPLALSIKQFHAKSQQDDTAPTLAMETDGGSSLGLTSLFFKHGWGSTVRSAQSHLKFLMSLSPILNSLWDIYFLS